MSQALGRVAQVVGPALGKAAEAVGKQFNVDPAGIADAFTMKNQSDAKSSIVELKSKSFE